MHHTAVGLTGEFIGLGRRSRPTECADGAGQMPTLRSRRDSLPVMWHPPASAPADRPTAPEAKHMRRGRRQRYPLQPKQRSGTPRTQRVRAHVCGCGRPHRLAEARALRAVRRDARAVRVVRLKAVVAHKPETARYRTHGPLAGARLKKGRPIQRGHRRESRTAQTLPGIPRQAPRGLQGMPPQPPGSTRVPVQMWERVRGGHRCMQPQAWVCVCNRRIHTCAQLG